ncbi:hypothetical protein [Proteus myxofaciens]|uniref:Uncharacterized protein n=1 Tax=Proteus myxofaciens ATCC 19692 TaxID=1354337 RepID=A0A198FCL1_9GAMM|nr:hypothetical protein [Proteus myxofaciens]OAT22129.1 hypothetical protein M983_2996 [Proteus myxofaciens ATCC 19692]
MSDNAIQLKVSVDTSDLDKLEEQLTRIKQLKQDVGVKPKSTPQFSGKLFIKDAFINSAEYKGVLVSNKLDADTKDQLTDLRMLADRQDASINELIKARQEEHQAWAQAVNHIFSKASCS